LKKLSEASVYQLAHSSRTKRIRSRRGETNFKSTQSSRRRVVTAAA
jgi:hypothetical protein